MMPCQESKESRTLLVMELCTMENGREISGMGMEYNYGKMEPDMKVWQKQVHDLIGEWRMHKANGKGKFVHVNGDVFDGKSLSIFLFQECG